MCKTLKQDSRVWATENWSIGTTQKIMSQIHYCSVKKRTLHLVNTTGKFHLTFVQTPEEQVTMFLRKENNFNLHFTTGNRASCRNPWVQKQKKKKQYSIGLIIMLSQTIGYLKELLQLGAELNCIHHLFFGTAAKSRRDCKKKINLRKSKWLKFNTYLL